MEARNAKLPENVGSVEVACEDGSSSPVATCSLALISVAERENVTLSKEQH